MSDDALRYPIGKFAAKDNYTAEEIQENISRIESLPSKVESTVKSFTEKHLATAYREGGWTGRQVIHHMADSHMNAYIRFKWSLTENTPVIKAYNEKLWAETPEVTLDPALSVNLLKALHVKWAALLTLVNENDLQKEFIHPETQKHIRLDRLIALYAWHGEHHLGHLKIIGGKN
jgi:hypothetical protein